MSVISIKRTGRGWGNKVPLAIISNTDGLITYEADFWEGGDDDTAGEYVRRRVCGTKRDILANASRSWSGYSVIESLR